MNTNIENAAITLGAIQKDHEVVSQHRIILRFFIWLLGLEFCTFWGLDRAKIKGKRKASDYFATTLGPIPGPVIHQTYYGIILDTPYGDHTVWVSREYQELLQIGESLPVRFRLSQLDKSKAQVRLANS